MLASGVRHNPDPVSAVRRTNGGSRYAVPFRIIPDLGQVSENPVKSATAEHGNVFHDDVAWSYLVNNSGVLAPEAAPRSRDACAFSRSGDILAGESSANNLSCSPELVTDECFNIVMDCNVGPVFMQDVLTVWVNFTKGDDSKSSSAFKSERETTNSGK
jgi:hypothetical protein